MSFERDRMIMLRDSLWEERKYTDQIVEIVSEINNLDASDYDNVVGYQSAVRVLASGIVKRHIERAG